VAINAEDLDGGSTDNCGIVSIVASETAFDCSDLGTNTVTLTVTDAAGNSSTCSAVVTVVDNTNPAITCPANITVGTDAPNCSAAVSYNVNATDNCGAQVSVSPASGSVFTVGTTTVTATATDGSGNTATCSFTVTVNDDDAPAAVCQNASVTLDANGTATITASSINNGSSDNCGIASIVASQTSFTCANTGANTVTLTVTDNSGNVSTCSAVVTVVDNTNPVITCPANMTVIAPSGQCTAEVNFNVSATDNCSATVTVTPASGSTFNVGTTTVTGTATDPSGNTATCSFNVTVIGNGTFALTGVPADTTLACGQVIPAAPPILPCSTGVIVPCDFRTQTQGGWGANCNGNNPGCYRDAHFAAAFPNGLTIGCVSNRTLTLTSSAAVNTFLPCGGTAAVLGQSYVNPSCINNVFASQLIAATLSVGFDNANPSFSASATSLGSLVVASGPLAGQTVNQVIAQANSLIGGCGSSYSIGDLNTALTNINQNYVDGTTCGGFLLQPGGGGSCCPSQHHGVSATSGCGPCPTITFSEVTVAGNCAGNYTIIRTWTATDSLGNSLSESQTITIIDNTAPAISCPGTITVNSGAGICGANVNFNVTATDLCGAATVTTSIASGSLFPIGTTVVTATATDACGNVSTCTFNVVVNDNQNPVITCPANITVGTSAPNCSAAVNYNVTATDNCAGQVNVSVSPASGSTFNVGTTTVNATATDASGNTATCSFTVTVNDDDAPSAICRNATVTLGANGTATITASTINNGSSDNCGIASIVASQTSFTCANVGPRTVTLTVTDNSGNVSTCTATVTVVDNTNPTITCPANITVGTSAPNCSAAVNYNVTAADNCGATVTVSPASGSVFNVGTTTVNATATDPSGNTATCSFTVRVNDDDAPSAICRNATVTLGANGTASITASTINNGSSDNCGIASIVASQTNFTCATVGPRTVTLTVTDNSGNVSTCTATVTVVDNTSPVITCPANISVNATASCSTAVNYNVTATDNCSATVSVSPASGTVFTVGTHTVTATATDPSGNTATCSFTVTVTGSGAFTITGVPADLNLSCGTAIPAPPAIVPCNSGNVCPTVPATYSGFTYLGDYNGTRYYRSNGSVSWPNAVTGANSIGAKLVTIESLSENNWLATQLGNSGNYWIGLNDVASEGNFVWSNGSTSSYRNWNSGEPNNYNGNEDYVEFIASSGKWNDQGAITRSYVIELACSSGNNNSGGGYCGGSSSCGGHNSSSCTGSSGSCGGSNCYGHHNSTSCGGYSGYCSGNACSGNHNNNYCGGNSNNCGGSNCSGHHNNNYCAGNGCYGGGGSGGSGGGSAVGVTATSACGPCPTVTYNQVTVAGNCPGNYTIIRTWTATDAYGNSISDSQTITVTDNTRPVLSGVPSNTTVSCGNLPAVPNVTATDACDPSVPVTYTQTTTGSGCNQTVTRTWTATDDCGNTVTASQVITVNDNVAPTISCPSTTTVNAAQGQCGANVTYNATATDNCSSVTVTYNRASGSLFNVGTTPVTATATDACGNTRTCSFNVVVNDNQNPVISCPANITVTAPAGQCSTAVSYNVTATDNCSATVSVSPASGSVFSGGTTTVNATATDPSGRTATCSFTVTVNTTASVAINCPANITTTCEAGGAVVTWATPTAVITGGCGASSCPTNPVCYNGLTHIGDYNGSRYYITNNAMSWTNAKAAAQAIGGNLVTIETSAENNWLNSLANGQAGHFWIGLNDANTEGTYVWSSGSGATYRNWNSGQPDNYNNEDYAEFITPSGKWNDWPSSSCTQGIIEIPCSGSGGNVTVTQIAGPASGSTFQPGTTTITYQASNGLGATATCSFTVTVEEVFEVLCPGNVTIPCTAGCGPNGSNGGVVAWNEPTVIWESCNANVCAPSTCLNGFNYLGEYNGHRYFISDAGASWSAAKTAAQNAGGNLVTINNSSENTWLNNQISGSNVYWIGLNDASSEGNFVWASGSSSTYRAWTSGEPNNGGSGGNQDHVVFNASGGLWMDRSGSDCNLYILELDCESYTLVQTAGPANGSFQTPGTYTVSYTATTTTGLTANCSFNVTVQSCAANYCTPSGTTCYEWIRQVAVSNLNNWSGNDNGYENFTQYSATVNRGSSYTMTLRPQFANQTYNETWRVYVDWNRDGDFNDSGELEFTTSGTSTVTGTLSVPSSSPLGSTRMRVVMRYEQCSSYNGPCSNVGYGEVEDYTLIVNGTGSRVIVEPNGTDENDVVFNAASAESAQDDVMGDLTGLRLTKIFPVPTDRDVNLEFLSLIEGKVVIEVMDLNGKVMMETTQDMRVDNNYIKLDVSRLPMATYLVKVSNGKESFTEKFVKQ
jgi:hypothetical protein